MSKSNRIVAKCEQFEVARIEQGLTKMQLAQAADVSPTTITRALNGEGVRAPVAKRLAAALEKPILEVFEIRE